MTSITEMLHKIVEEHLPQTVRAEIIDGELIVITQTPPLHHALTISRLRDALDPDVWINPASSLVMAIEVVSGKDNSNAARRDRKDKARSYAASGVPLYLLVDRPRKQAVLHSEPHFVPDLKSGRYARVVNVTYGEPLELPEPFNRTIDTSIFEH